MTSVTDDVTGWPLPNKLCYWHGHLFAVNLSSKRKK